ncbi:hypothetical protein IIB50_00545 [Patescibacteria group bacterium]|nr:hypothetical protein [Patescibacteria group bacterium]
MRNLLPIKDKKHIRLEYLIRLLSIAMFFVFFTALLSSIFLLPSFFISQTKEIAIRDQAEVSKRALALREQNTSDILLNESKEKLNLLSSGVSRPLIQNAIRTIIDDLPSGVVLYIISYSEIPDEHGRISLIGVADRRSVLLSFKKFLEQEALFSSVTLPVSNLAQDSDINFSIQLNMEF